MNNELKFFAYCRKSSEDSKKQIASIQDQENSVSKMVDTEKLNLVIPPFKEEKSSKDPGRPIFNEMLDRIEKGEANAIICWDIDRLYRNPVDEGRLRWMLQKGVIKVIRTPYRQFYPDDAGLLMGVEGGRATDYVIRLSKNVKRGLNSKVMQGWRPTGAPIGYKNIGDVGDKTIVPDPERFHIVRQMWDLFLTGVYPVSKIHEIANTKFGLRTPTRKKLGGKPLTLTNVYEIFNDAFYYGSFYWNDPENGERKLFQGKHQPMITEKEFIRAKALLGRKSKPRPQVREFAFTGLVECGECHSAITAETKEQIICTQCKYKFSSVNKTQCPKCQTDSSEMKNPKILNYVYYHCTKKKNKNCTQKYIKLEELEKQFNVVLGDLKIDDDYLKIALDYLQEKEKSSGTTEKSIRVSLQSAYDDCQTRLKNLEREFTSSQNSNHELYSATEYVKSKNQILEERTVVEQSLSKVKENFDHSISQSERIFNFCTLAQKVFNGKDLKKKREIFSTIGSNLTLKDQKLIIDRLHPYLLIENELKEQKKLYSALEPEKEGYAERKKAAFAASVPSWLRE